MNAPRWLSWLLFLASSPLVPPGVAQDLSLPDPLLLADIARKSKAITEGKNVKIHFYGKVVDQDEKPLAGAIVKASAREWYMKNLFEPAGRNHYDTKTTGPDGRFSFDAFHGDAFELDSIAKEGYVLTKKTARGYTYGPLAHHYTPNPLVPVVFHMWKTNGAVPLYVVSIVRSIPQDGTVMTFDLRRNRQVAEPTDVADIRITLHQHAPAGQRNVIPHFDWSFVLEVPDGGVIKTQDEFTYLAPEQGYQPKWAIEYLKDQANWKFIDEADFYLKNRSGEQFGILSRP